MKGLLPLFAGRAGRAFSTQAEADADLRVAATSYANLERASFRLSGEPGTVIVYNARRCPYCQSAVPPIGNCEHCGAPVR